MIMITFFRPSIYSYWRNELPRKVFQDVRSVGRSKPTSTDWLGPAIVSTARSPPDPGHSSARAQRRDCLWQRWSFAGADSVARGGGNSCLGLQDVLFLVSLDPKIGTVPVGGRPPWQPNARSTSQM